MISTDSNGSNSKARTPTLVRLGRVVAVALVTAALAGLFAAGALNDPSNSDSSVGLRCGR